MPGATAEANPVTTNRLAGTTAPRAGATNRRAGTLVYDGDCGFCTAAARWLKRRLSSDCLVVPSQAADLAALGLTEADVARSAWWVDPDGVAWDDHASIAGALRAVGGRWSAVGRVLVWGPLSPLARAVYRLVANNRHRIRKPGAKGCPLP